MCTWILQILKTPFQRVLGGTNMCMYMYVHKYLHICMSICMYMYVYICDHMRISSSFTSTSPVGSHRIVRIHP